MQTLAQTLATGNTAGGTSIEMGGAALDLNDGSGAGGGNLNLDAGTIVVAGAAAIINNNGAGSIQMGDNNGVGNGTQLLIDDNDSLIVLAAAQITLSGTIAVAAGTPPANPAVISGWLNVLVGGTLRSVPYYT